MVHRETSIFFLFLSQVLGVSDLIAASFVFLFFLCVFPPQWDESFVNTSGQGREKKDKTHTLRHKMDLDSFLHHSYIILSSDSSGTNGSSGADGR